MLKGTESRRHLLSPLHYIFRENKTSGLLIFDGFHSTELTLGEPFSLVSRRTTFATIADLNLISDNSKKYLNVRYGTWEHQ